jgi:hypothetical protein
MKYCVTATIAVGMMMARDVPWAWCCETPRSPTIKGINTTPPPIPANPLKKPPISPTTR